MNKQEKILPFQQQDELLRVLNERFERNPQRHPGLTWAQVSARLMTQPEKLWSLNEMEKTGGEPDVTGCDETSGGILFVDCAAETPAGRRNVCYDHAAWEARKKARPETSALDMAAAMGIALLSEADYFALQRLGEFDTKTSSWLQTPAEVRQRGGALFGDRRFGRVFIYHNGADSYYSVRGFRGCLKV